MTGVNPSVGTLPGVDSASPLVRSDFFPDPDTITGGRQSIIEPLVGDHFTFDARGRLLPWLQPPRLDASTSRLHAGGNAAAVADLAEVDLEDTRATGSWSWQIVGPRFTDITLPRFTCGLADLNPRPNDHITTTAVLIDTYGAMPYAKA